MPPYADQCSLILHSSRSSTVWRRTGEIFKGNREFAELVGIPYEQLRDGKLAIYELMSEDSAVNFWEVSVRILNLGATQPAGTRR